MRKSTGLWAKIKMRWSKGWAEEWWINKPEGPTQISEGRRFSAQSPARLDSSRNHTWHTNSDHPFKLNPQILISSDPLKTHQNIKSAKLWLRDCLKRLALILRSPLLRFGGKSTPNINWSLPESWVSWDRSFGRCFLRLAPEPPSSRPCRTVWASFVALPCRRSGH